MKTPHTGILACLLIACNCSCLQADENAADANKIGAPPKGDPVVVLMDTTAPGGVYDQDNRDSGGSNTKEIKSALEEHDFLPLMLLARLTLQADQHWRMRVGHSADR